eukprot:COSAG03_NODE_14113_length_476_cov_1.668435_1_plen_45_part_01
MLVFIPNSPFALASVLCGVTAGWVWLVAGSTVYGRQQLHHAISAE